jgi:hypothetical protein
MPIYGSENRVLGRSAERELNSRNALLTASLWIYTFTQHVRKTTICDYNKWHNHILEMCSSRLTQEIRIITNQTHRPRGGSSSTWNRLIKVCLEGDYYWHHLDALFLTEVYFGLKFCPSILEIVGLRVPARYIRDFALFNVCSSYKNCPSARCASAANVVCRDVDVFGARNILLSRLL